MKLRSSQICFGVALMLFAVPSLVAADENKGAVEAARKYFADLRDGNYETCADAHTGQMREALPAEKLKAVWAQVTAAFGAYKSESSTDVTAAGDLQIVDLNSKFERGNLRVRISLDEDGQVSGLFFTPIAEDVPYTPPSYVDQAKFREEQVEIAVGGLSLPGTVTLPVGKGPFPGVVLVHGSGPHDQDETIHQRKPFKDITWGLASRGIAVMRYDKRTYKYGDRLKPSDITLDVEVADDAIVAAGMLAGRDDVRSDRVFIVGHSLGATAAPYIGLRDESIAGLVMLCPAARPIFELVLDQVNYIANVDGTVDEEERKDIEEIQATVERLRKREYKPGESLLAMPVEYWVDIERMAPLENGKKYAKPMLLVFGGRDYQITSKDSSLWKQALEGKSNATLKIFDSLDHLLNVGEGESKPEDYQKPGYVEESVIKYVADWLNKNSK